MEINWNLDWKAYLSTIIRGLEMRNVHVDCKISDQSYWVNADKSSRILSGGNYPFNKIQKYNYDYLLPAKDNNEEINIELPSFVTVIIELSILLIECSPEDKKHLLLDKLKESLKIGLIIGYKDNLEKVFQNKYTYKIGKIALQIDTKITGTQYHLLIEREK